MAAARTMLNVQSFPRPPRLERISRHIQIKWHGTTIADTREAYWVLETHHPPTYYIPPSAVTIPLTRTSRSTYCEWKGAATYFSARDPAAGGTAIASDRIWAYDEPSRAFGDIAGYLSFYAGAPWDCFVDGERVEAQPGDFYGGWVTGEIEGIVKGRHGNWDPVA